MNPSNGEIWEFGADASKFVAEALLVQETMKAIKKLALEMAKEQEQNVRQGIDSTEAYHQGLKNLTSDYADQAIKLNQINQQIQEYVQRANAARDAVIDWNAANQKSSAAQGPYVTNVEYASGRRASDDVASQRMLAGIAEAGRAQQEIVGWEQQQERIEERIAFLKKTAAQQSEADAVRQSQRIDELYEKYKAIEAQKKAASLFSFSIENEQSLGAKKDAEIENERSIAEAKKAIADELTDYLIGQEMERRDRRVALAAAQKTQERQFFEAETFFRRDNENEYVAVALNKFDVDARYYAKKKEAAENDVLFQRIAAKQELQIELEKCESEEQLERLLAKTRKQILDEQLSEERIRAALALDAGGPKAQQIADLKIQLASLRQQERGLEIDAKNAMDAARSGAVGAHQAYVNLEGVLIGVRDKIKDVERGLEGAHGMRSAKTMMTEAARGAQDFVTVLAMPGMGLTDALRAASNNVEVMLMNVKSLNYGYVAMISMIPSVIQGAVSLYHWFNKEAAAAAAAEEAERKKHDEYVRGIGTMENYNAHLREMNSLNGQNAQSIEGIIESEGRMIDTKREQQMKAAKAAYLPASQELAAAERENSRAQKEFDSARERLRTARPEEGAAASAAFLAAKTNLEYSKEKLPDLRHKVRELEAEIADIEKESTARIAKAAMEKQLKPRSAVISALAKLAAGQAEITGDVSTAADKIIWESGVTPDNEAQYNYVKNRMIAETKEAMDRNAAAKAEGKLSPEVERRRKEKAQRDAAIKEKLELGGFDVPIEDAQDKIRAFEIMVREQSPRGIKPNIVRGPDGKVIDVKERDNELKLQLDRAKDAKEKEELRLKAEDRAKGFTFDQGNELIRLMNNLLDNSNAAVASSNKAAPPRIPIGGWMPPNPNVAAFAEMS